MCEISEFRGWGLKNSVSSGRKGSRYPYLVSPEPDPEDVSSDVGAEDDDEPVEDHEEGEEAEHQEPEPDEDVDLLVDDVEGEDAQHVVVLDVAGRPVLVKRALRHSKETCISYFCV